MENENYIKEFENEIIHLKNKNKELSNMMYEIIHDLKNPLIVIGGYLSLILKSENEKSEENKNLLLQKASREITTLNNITKKFLDYLTLYNSIDDIKVDKVDLTTILNYYYDFYSEVSIKKNINLRMNYLNKIPFISGNEEKISYIISNILSNLINTLNKTSLIDINVKKVDNYAAIDFIYKDIESSSNDAEVYSDKDISNYKIFFRIILELMKKIDGVLELDLDNPDFSSIVIKFKLYN